MLFVRGPARVLLIGAIFGKTAKTVQEVVQQIKRKQISERFGRDLARCIMTEQVCPVMVYTMDRLDSLVNDSQPREDRHIDCDASKVTQLKKILPQFKVLYDQIIVDFVWFNAAYWETCLKRPFFSDTIPELFLWLNKEGTIYLPACSYFYLGISREWEKLSSMFELSFICENDLNQVSLHVGTLALDESEFQSMFGKEPNQIGKLSISRQLVYDGCSGKKEHLTRFDELMEKCPNPTTVRLIQLCKV